MGKFTPGQKKEFVIMNIEVPAELHSKLKQVARPLDRRSMHSFVLEAISERVGRFLQNELESDQFIPEGLRR